MFFLFHNQNRMKLSPSIPHSPTYQQVVQGGKDVRRKAEIKYEKGKEIKHKKNNV